MGLGGYTQGEPRDSPPSVPDAPRVKRRSRCKWVSWDDEGRPSCEHGTAFKAGARDGVPYWRCRKKKRETEDRYAQSDKGRESRRRANSQPRQLSRKALYDMTRVRDPF